jgi:hypothetical protein
MEKDFTIDSYIRAQWSAGERDSTLVAERLLKAILASPSAHGLLLPLVHNEVQARYRSLSRALERGGLGAHGLPGRRPQSRSGPSQGHRGPAAGGAGTLDRRERLMREYRWVPSKGNVRYSDCTAADLRECVSWLTGVRQGMDRSIDWLIAAATAMELSGVQHRGDLADSELPAGAP